MNNWRANLPTDQLQCANKLWSHIVGPIRPNVLQWNIPFIGYSVSSIMKPYSSKYGLGNSVNSKKNIVHKLSVVYICWANVDGAGPT